MWLAFGLLICVPFEASAQQNTLQVQVRHDSKPVPGAVVTLGGTTEITDALGVARLPVPAGATRLMVTVTKEGFIRAEAVITVTPGVLPIAEVDLRRQPDLEEAVTVSATRTGGRIDDIPMRVEVLGREEIEEKMLMTPGDIVMLLNEMGGLRVQATSPGLGSATVRVQGMRGRYTRFFSDGLPLFGEVGGLGLLQVPPMDLGQVEVIKGVASSLYGAGAMGGVVNLVSRQPGGQESQPRSGSERELLINRSTRGGTDVAGWYSSSAVGNWALTLIGGGHFQTTNDVDDDGWANLAGYSRVVVRPRLFWNDRKGSSMFVTAGFMAEDRTGGTIDVDLSGVNHPEELKSRRFDAGMVVQKLLGGRHLISARVAFSRQGHDHLFGDVRERDRHRTGFAEVTARTQVARSTIVFGAALERDSYRPTDVPDFAFGHWIPGAFVQADVPVTQWISLSASGRVDHHSEYGTFFSPRVSVLVRRGSWSSRASAGTGFFGPTPLTEETEAAGLSRLEIPAELEAERGRSFSIDVTREAGPLMMSLTYFDARVEHPIHVERASGLVLTNLEQPATSRGMEALVTFRQAPFSVTATYSLVRAREVVDGLEEDVPLTPRHNAGLVGMWEREDVGRVGVELYFTGSQRLEENPYRTSSRPYVIFGVLAERSIGKYRLFINGENLTGVRQTRWDPLARPSRAPDGRWTVDVWAPLEGRNVNGGLRVRF